MENKKNRQQTDDGRVMTKYDRKIQQRNAEALRARKKKMAVRGTAIAVVAVCVVLIAFVIISNVGKSISYIKVDDKSISKEEFNFYYMRTVNYYGSMYSSYGYLDSSVALDQQQYTDNLTWKDYFEELATEEIVRVKALVKDAEKNDFEGDVEELYQKYIKNLKDDAKENEISEKEYFENMFGASEKDVEKYMKEYLLAESWYDEVSDSKKATDEEIEAYYQENKASYDCIDYYIYPVSASGVSADTSTEEEIDAAMEVAKAGASIELGLIEARGEYKEAQAKSEVEAVLTDWLFADERVDNDTTVFVDEDNLVCYALKFMRRYRDEEPTVDIRAAITTSDAVDAEAVLEKWSEGDKTEDSFIELVNKYTADTSVEDGMYEGVTRSGMDEKLSEWIFAADRKEGDTTALTTDGGYKYMIYYKGTNDPEYKFAIKDALLNDAMESYVTALTDVIKVADPNGVLKYLETAGE